MGLESIYTLIKGFIQRTKEFYKQIKTESENIMGKAIDLRIEADEQAGYDLADNMFAGLAVVAKGATFRNPESTKDAEGKKVFTYPQRSVDVNILLDVPTATVVEFASKFALQAFSTELRGMEDSELEAIESAGSYDFALSSVKTRKPSAPKQLSRADLLALLAGNPDLLAEAIKAQERMAGVEG